MKKRLSLAMSLASAVMLSASQIEWDLPNLTTTAGDTTTPLNLNNIVFLLTSDATSVNDGVIENATAVANADQGVDYIAGGYTYGSYYDDISTGTANYIMAYYNSENGKYYAISNGSDGYITASVNNDADPRNVVTGGYAGFSAVGNGMTRATTVAQSVPEPATAALALAGLAMLIRRRRAS